MKTNTNKIMKTLALVLVLASAATTEGMAQTKATSGKVSSLKNANTLSVQDLGSLRFKLTFENPLRQKTQIYLLDKYNEVYYEAYSSGEETYIKAFNLKNLADGEYTFVVEIGKEKLKKDLTISTQTFRGITLASNR